MTGAFEWLGKLVEWFGQFFPRWTILDTTEGAVKFVGGKKVIVCGPGIWWWWPARTVWIAYPTARQTDRLESQTLESTDGKTFMVSGTLTYMVEDLGKLLPFTHSATKNTLDIAAAALHDVCCDFSWDELQSEQRKGTIKTKLRNEAQKQLGEYGIRVIKFQLNSLARCRVLKVSQSTSSEEN